MSPSSAGLRCASVPIETGGIPALLQSYRPSVRAESPGQEAGPIQLLFHTVATGKVGKHVRPRVSQFFFACLCFLERLP